MQMEKLLDEFYSMVLEEHVKKFRKENSEYQQCQEDFERLMTVEQIEIIGLEIMENLDSRL